MTQEYKQLLLQDLCARLPYKCVYSASRGITHWNKVILNIDTITKLINNEYNTIKPYLRPMSSMTEEEKHKLLKFGAITCLKNGEVIDVSCVGFERHADVQDYLNAHHFDYRGLIEKGLALEAPEEMYK